MLNKVFEILFNSHIMLFYSFFGIILKTYDKYLSFEKPIDFY